jgi:hypothetical protein
MRISVIFILLWLSGIRILILPVLIMRIRIKESHISADPSGSRTQITSSHCRKEQDQDPDRCQHVTEPEHWYIANGNLQELVHHCSLVTVPYSIPTFRFRI